MVLDYPFVWPLWNAAENSQRQVCKQSLTLSESTTRDGLCSASDTPQEAWLERQTYKTHRIYSLNGPVSARLAGRTAPQSCRSDQVVVGTILQTLRERVGTHRDLRVSAEQLSTCLSTQFAALPPVSASMSSKASISSIQGRCEHVREPRLWAWGGLIGNA